MNVQLFSWSRCACAALICGSLNVATASTVAVYPTGSVSLDVNNVQTAIDTGGTVLLKAKNRAGQATAFNFGAGDQASGVNINVDVSIVGERIGRYSTTINGGFIPILGFVPVRSTIQGIDFEGPIDSPIVLAASTGANIIGNRVRGNIPAPLCAPPCTHTEVEGLLVSGYNDPANAVTGQIRVIDNDFELSGGSFANGMQFDEVAADIEVRGNNVKFLQTDGIVQTIGILVFRSRGRASVVANSVTIGPGNPDAYPSGIFVAGHEQARYFIFGNSVTTNHPNADGIDVLGLPNSGATQHAIVEGNFVRIHSTIDFAGGIAFGGAVSNSLMAANIISGTSGNALQMLGFDSTLTADSNAAIGNDISRLTPVGADVYLGEDANNNVVIGRCNTYQDFGTGNRISCGHAVSSSLLMLPSRGQAADATNRPRPMLDLLGNTIRPAGLDGIRNRPAH